MTFEQFIATRQRMSVDAGADLVGLEREYFPTATVALHVYDGTAYIEELADGTFYLLIGRDGYESQDIAELERILWDWADGELYGNV